MKIRVKGFLKFKMVMRNEVPLEMDIEKCTLRDVFYELSRRFGKDFEDLIFDPRTKKVKTSNMILVNGRPYMNLRNRFDSELEEGDEIMIYPAMVGG